jgi:hypothetical protein
MCKKNKGLHNRIDPCLKPLLKWLKSCDYDIVASCCGHSVYPMSIIVRGRKNGIANYGELLSGININRTKKFYKRDKQGYYFIPEVIKESER